MLHDAIEETFLSKWFHKETLISEEPLCFTKGSLWRKKKLFGLYKVKEQMVLCGTKFFYFMALLKKLLNIFIFKSVKL